VRFRGNKARNVWRLKRKEREREREREINELEVVANESF